MLSLFIIYLRSIAPEKKLVKMSSSTQEWIPKVTFPAEKQKPGVSGLCAEKYVRNVPSFEKWTEVYSICPSQNVEAAMFFDKKNVHGIRKVIELLCIVIQFNYIYMYTALNKHKHDLYCDTSTCVGVSIHLHMCVFFYIFISNLYSFIYCSCIF